jgi:AAHS family 4-hydroxybenzoate transporter-like MFS transporter
MERAPTVSELIDGRPMGRYQLWTMALCGMVIVLDGFDTQSIGFLAPSMAESLRIPVKNFGPIFGAALFGLMISSMLIGPMADRWGRKWPIVICTLLFGTFAMLTARATTFSELRTFRLVTGLGLGGALSNVVALLSEYAPKRLVAVLVSILFCGMPAGALLGALVSWFMLPRWGWQSVFYAGGVLPFALALLLIAILPESVRYLEISGKNQQRISQILARISPDLANASFARASQQDQRRKVPVVHLFTEGRAAATLLLWIPFFMNLLILYFIVSWQPALLRQSGMPARCRRNCRHLFVQRRRHNGIGRGRHLDQPLGCVRCLACRVRVQRPADRFPGVFDLFPTDDADHDGSGLRGAGGAGRLECDRRHDLSDFHPLDGNRLGARDRAYRFHCGAGGRWLVAEIRLGAAPNFFSRRGSCSVRRRRNPHEPLA